MGTSTKPGGGLQFGGASLLFNVHDIANSFDTSLILRCFHSDVISMSLRRKLGDHFQLVSKSLQFYGQLIPMSIRFHVDLVSITRRRRL